MYSLLQKLPFFLELFLNGSFILVYSLREAGKVPESWDFIILDQVLLATSYIVPLVILLTLVVNYSNSKSFELFFRKYIFSIVVFFPLVITAGDQEFTFWLASSHLLASVLSLYENENSHGERRSLSPKRVTTGFKFSPAQLVLFTFFGIIGVGAVLLMLPFSTKSGHHLNFTDALFMATSATCVTGLSTVSLQAQFSLFGQIIILILIQVGGLGYMTLYSSVIMAMGRSLGMKDRLVMQDLLNISSQEELFSMIVDIMKYTFVIEMWGGIILTIGFTSLDYELGQAIYYGFFHSVSAFCNAGFSLFETNLESFANNPIIHGTISVLVILGGLGFIVLRELKFALKHKRPFVRFGMHTKIVLLFSAILIVSGAVFIFFGEFLHALDGYSLWDKIQISFFQSVTLRTAGFNTIPLTSLNKYTIYLMSLFMFIGAAPGSTGGGIKITTFAILIQSIKATLKGQSTVELFDRKIPQSMVVRATALTIISLIITSLFILILMKLEPNQSFLTIFFEVISASGTVGLSLGITPELSQWGKVAISVLMFVGRTGPLTLVLAIGQSQVGRGQFEYPEGRVMIG